MLLSDSRIHQKIKIICMNNEISKYFSTYFENYNNVNNFFELYSQQWVKKTPAFPFHFILFYIIFLLMLALHYGCSFYFISFFLFSDKSVSFEKSVSFSDDIQGVPKTHSPQHLGKSMSLKITSV